LTSLRLAVVGGKQGKKIMEMIRKHEREKEKVMKTMRNKSKGMKKQNKAGSKESKETWKKKI
jgi:hypothetical protein